MHLAKSPQPLQGAFRLARRNRSTGAEHAPRIPCFAPFIKGGFLTPLTKGVARTAGGFKTAGEACEGIPAQ